LMKETKSQNQQACQKKKYTSQKNENIVCRKKHHLMRERGCKNWLLLQPTGWSRRSHTWKTKCVCLPCKVGWLYYIVSDNVIVDWYLVHT
jgi:hypothetical protein